MRALKQRSKDLEGKVQERVNKEILEQLKIEHSVGCVFFLNLFVIVCFFSFKTLYQSHKGSYVFLENPLPIIGDHQLTYYFMPP